MLLDATYVAALTADLPSTAKTITFLGKMISGIFYVDAVPSAGVISCQVRKGDGTAVAVATNVLVRTISTSGATIAVNTGTVEAGAGAATCWVQSNSSGVLQVTITGTGAVLVEFSVNQGVSMFVQLLL